jgi:hypothetical protein
VARTLLTGFEIGAVSDSNITGAQRSPDYAFSYNGTKTFDTGTVRAGSSSLKTTSDDVRIHGGAKTTTSNWSVFIAVRLSSLPASFVKLIEIEEYYVVGENTVLVAGYPTETRFYLGANYASAPVLTSAVWHTIEVRYTATTTTSGSIDCFIDTKFVCNVTGTHPTALTELWLQLAPSDLGAGGVWYDDLVVDIGETPTAAIVDSRVFLLKPISDNQRGSWTGGAGGVSNLWDAVDNVPPVGTATETDTTQIESADSSGNNATDEYRVNLTTYSDAGIKNATLIRNVMLCINHGEDISTGSKTITAGMFSNPAGSLPTAWDVAPASGLLATYPSQWFWTRIVQSVSFSGVDVNASPVVNMRKTDTSTRVASVDFIGLYVECRPTSDAPRRAFPPPILNL